MSEECRPSASFRNFRKIKPNGRARAAYKVLILKCKKYEHDYDNNIMTVVLKVFLNKYIYANGYCE